MLVGLYRRDYYDDIGNFYKSLYWFFLIGGAAAISIFFYSLTRSLFYEKRISPYLNIAVSTLLSILVCAYWAKLLMHFFIPVQGWLSTGQLMIYSICIVGTACVVVFLSVPFPKTVSEQASMRPPSFENKLISRLPYSKQGAVISVEMSDHYAKITTTKGSEMLHLRMSDAVEQLSDHDGIQIHRSFWINRKYLKEVYRDGRKTMVRLTNGSEFPIGDSFIKKAADAGLI